MDVKGETAKEKEMSQCYDRIDDWLDKKGVFLLTPSQIGRPKLAKLQNPFEEGKTPAGQSFLLQSKEPLNKFCLNSSPLFQRRSKKPSETSKFCKTETPPQLKPPVKEVENMNPKKTDLVLLEFIEVADGSDYT